MNRIGIVTKSYNKTTSTAATEYADNTSGTQIAGLSEANTLAPGAIALFESSGALIDIIAAQTTPTSADYVILAIGTTNGVRTTHIAKGTPKAELNDYVAPVAKIVDFGYTAQTTGAVLPFAEADIVLGQEYLIKVTKPYLHHEDPENYKIYGIVTTNAVFSLAATKTESVLKAIKAKMDLDEAFHDLTIAVTYSASTQGGLKFTSNTAGIEFDVQGLEMFRSTAVAIKTANVLGEGTYTEVVEMEKKYTTEEGNTDQWGYTNGMGGLVSEITTGNTSTFDVLHLKYTRPNTQVPNAKSYGDTLNYYLPFFKSAVAGENGSTGRMAVLLTTTLNAYV